jgi:hypothetical protein
MLRPTKQFLPCSRAWRIWLLVTIPGVQANAHLTAHPGFSSLSSSRQRATQKHSQYHCQTWWKAGSVLFSFRASFGFGPFHTHKRRSAHVCMVFCVLRSAVAFGQGLGYFYYVLIKLSFDSPLFTSLISCSLGFLALWQAATYLGVREVNQANSVCDSRLPR